MSTIPANDIVQVIPSVLNAGGTGLLIQPIILTTSYRVPIGEVLPFSSALSVADFFGDNSEEAAAASVYFLGYDNSSIKPQSCLFAQYNTTAVCAYLQGGSLSGVPLATLQALSGTLDVIIDGYTHVASGLDFSSDNSLSAIAATIEGALTNPTVATSTASSISGTVLTVGGTLTGNFEVGQIISGTGVTSGSEIISLGTGTGGAGTYNLSASSTVASESISAAAAPVTVSYDSVSGAFLFQSGITGAPSLANYSPSGTIANALKLTQATGAVISQGAAAASPISYMDGIVGVTQDWATFMTIFDPDGGEGNTVKLAFCEWTNSQDNRYCYVCWDTDASPTASVPATESLGYLIGPLGNNYSGICLMYSPTLQYKLAAFVCGTAASINFNALNGRITFDFRSQTGLEAEVTTQTVATNLRANDYNFYGVWATAAQDFVFFNPGTVSGPFEWMDSYINQIWLNNAFQLDLMELLTQVNSIPYNPAGDALIEASLMGTILQGLAFGAYRTGVILSSLQVAEVNSAAGLNIAPILFQQGWYLQVLASQTEPAVRQARGSPPVNFWYMDGESVQQIVMNSILLQ